MNLTYRPNHQLQSLKDSLNSIDFVVTEGLQKFTVTICYLRKNGKGSSAKMAHI